MDYQDGVKRSDRIKPRKIYLQNLKMSKYMRIQVSTIYENAYL